MSARQISCCAASAPTHRAGSGWSASAGSGHGRVRCWREPHRTHPPLRPRANAMAEALSPAHTTGLIRARGPWRTAPQVELATLEWVWWWNTQQFRSELGSRTPTEAKHTFPLKPNPSWTRPCLKRKSRSGAQGNSPRASLRPWGRSSATAGSGPPGPARLARCRPGSRTAKTAADALLDQKGPTPRLRDAMLIPGRRDPTRRFTCLRFQGSRPNHPSTVSTASVGRTALAASNREVACNIG